MSTLRAELGTGAKRSEIVRATCEILDAEVDEKSGLGGLAVKGAYRMVKGVKPGFLPNAVDHLLDEFLDSLQPLVERAKERGVSAASYLTEHRSETANALLGVTDQHALQAKNAMMKKTYEKLRPTAQRHVEAAAPRLGELLDKHFTR